jgi:hypothetical protein
MKAAFSWLLLLAALLATACRASTPPARNTLPRRQPLTEAVTPENAEPSRKSGLELPDTARRELPKQP